MREVETLADHKFVSLKKVRHPEKNVNAYLYAERLGVDSVAFICFDPRANKILLNNEYKPPINDFVLGAFGGSLDKSKNPAEIVKAEVREEAGFEVEDKDIVCVGKSFVSTQMNQYCHLFIVLVFQENELDRQPENAIEAMATTKWIDREDVVDLDDWKAITIWAKRNNG